MDSAAKPSSASLFQVYLRLRPPPSPLVQLTPQSLYPSLPPPERYLTVEPPLQDAQDDLPTHITIHPPTDSRKRAVEKFAFTKVFQEDASQSDIFKGTGVIPLVAGVLGEGRDGLLATLGVTGSGKVIIAPASERAFKIETDSAIDSYHFRLQNTARSHSALFRPCLSLAGPSNTSSEP